MEKEFSSFKDPSGFIFFENNRLFRQVNRCYKEEYDFLMSSGIYDKLIEKKYMVSHKEIEKEGDFYKIIEPEFIDFISYPCEWSFSMLKDAALLTLKIQKMALKRGLSLKDASGYNIQFKNGKPIFIDTLSFEKFKETPWVAYAQFCRHFLSPLLLMAYTDIRLQGLLKNYIDGIPLDLVSKLLPFRTRLNPLISMHIHFHSKTSIKYEGNSKVEVKKLKMTNEQVLNLVKSLEELINGLKWEPKGTEWGEYYTFTNYTDESFEIKKEIVSEFLDKIQPKQVWDLGANNGLFTRVATGKGIESIAFDIDPVAVEKNYLQIKKDGEEKLLPIVLDLTNPTPAIGFANRERKSFTNRDKTDVTMALALIHHLSISNNLPFDKTAEFFNSFSKYLIIEFVPKEDSKVKILLSTREDIFPNYTKEKFEEEYSKYFEIIERKDIKDSKRTIYLMKAVTE